MRILARGLLLISSIVFSLASHATTLLILGDSLSAGYQMAEEKSWPRVLEKRWQSSRPEFVMINASISAETTAGGLQRLPALLARHNPDWVLLELGANDGLRGFSPVEPRTNLQQMIQLSQKSGAKVVLTQIRVPPNYGKRYVDSFESIYPELSKQQQIPLMPFFLEAVILKPELIMPDGLHPKAEAQSIIADEVATYLSPLLWPGRS